jgi:tetratricopeptide (TPR) repeat protein
MTDAEDPYDLVDQGRFEDAMRAFERAFATSGDPLDLVDASWAAEDAGLMDDAMRLVSLALQLDPGCARAYARLAMIYRDLRRWADARTMFEKALEHEAEERPSLLCLLGVTCRRLGDYEAAETLLRRAIAMEPDNDEFHHNLGSVLQPSRPLEAVEHFRRALAIDPARPFSRREMAFALWSADRLDDAIAACELAIEADGADAWAHFFLGCWSQEKGTLELARFELGRAVDLDPSIGLGWAYLAGVTATLGDHAAAEACFVEGLSYAPDSPGLCRDYGRWLARAGRTAEAIPHLRRALELNPNDRRARTSLAALGSMGEGTKGTEGTEKGVNRRNGATETNGEN